MVGAQAILISISYAFLVATTTTPSCAANQQNIRVARQKNITTSTTTENNNDFNNNNGQKIAMPLSWDATTTTTMMTMSDHLPHQKRNKINFQAHEIPLYLQRPYIRGRYRAYMTFQNCVESMFQIHNETAQIWSHLLPALYFWYQAFQHCFSTKKTMLNHSRRYLFAILCTSFAMVFTSSTFAHIFNPMGVDEEWFVFCWKVDWSAIAFAIFGSLYTFATLGFHDDVKRMKFWRIVFGIASSIFFICCSTSLFQTLKYPSIKISLAIVPGVCVFTFMLQLKHHLGRHQWQKVYKHVLSGPWYLTIFGCLVYGAQFPERYFPDVNFDMIRGHHLFHHLWSATCAYMVVENTIRWAKQIDKGEL